MVPGLSGKFSGTGVEMYERTGDFLSGPRGWSRRKFRHITICCDGTIFDSPEPTSPQTAGDIWTEIRHGCRCRSPR